MHFATIAAVSALTGQTFALGINCRGSGLCGRAGGDLVGVKAIVDGIQPRDRNYGSGQHIACAGNLCAFFQNSASGTADRVSGLLQQLYDHSCEVCGSVPTNGNNVNAGELTVNYVANPGCEGAC
ncbi:killer kp4 [Ophiostoma piceae UAMH 11346]|uniref:Killer kp4 n=1 Tax=Ophiostoma piceae (strain UAMH 11346) TaxID=1262450 RepID=S3BS58_OPHP1|nr:killer kp4 [Ophiostoma piceae UAMH 11346]